jgi:hypothetical protein
MIKEAIEKILGLADPHFREYNGMLLCDKTMHEIRPEPKPIERPAPDKLSIKTLSGLVDLVKADECMRWTMMYVMVASPSEVVVVTDPRDNESRVTLFTAQAVLPSIMFEKFMDVETAIIMLRSRFVQNEDTTNLIKLIGSIKEESVRNIDDDGISQAVVAKTGIGTKGLTPVEPIQKLRPYRTFLEVEQPESEFLFRLQSGAREGQGPTMAIFEADGGAWRNVATATVASYLAEKLADLPNVTVVQ